MHSPQNAFELLKLSGQAVAARRPDATAVSCADRSLTYRELDITSPAYWVYMASFVQKEVMSALNLVDVAVRITAPPL